MPDPESLPRDQAARIADHLADYREDLEAIASADGPFADRAANALAFLDALEERDLEPPQSQEVPDAA